MNFVPVPLGIVQLDVAVVSASDPSGDRESQPRAAIFSLDPRSIRAIKAFEDVMSRFWREFLDQLSAN